jgi:hypothetical protein
MRSLTILAFCGCLALLTPALRAQQRDHTSHQPALTYVDPVTGEFKQVTPQVDANILPATAPTTGTFVFKITITLKSTIPSSDVIVCNANANVTDVGSQTVNEELASVAATRTTTSATCTVSIPYSWVLTTATQDRVSLEYSVATAPSSSTGNPLPSREGIHGLAPIPVPATASTTTETVSTVM